MWIIEFEASGLNPLSYPIEVGLTNGDSNYQSLILPLPHWKHWCKKAQGVHGINRDILLKEGNSSIVVANNLNALLEGKTIYCDSVRWDSFWCNVLFSDNGIHQKFKILDVNELLLASYSLAESYLQIKIQLEKSGEFVRHRALDDAKIIREALMKAIKGISH